MVSRACTCSKGRAAAQAVVDELVDAGTVAQNIGEVQAWATSAKEAIDQRAAALVQEMTRVRELKVELGEQQLQVIEGLDPAIPRMSVGQVAEITIPSELAYGVQGYPPLIPPKSDLVFVVELIGLL